jgi:uncharacterized protein (DUF2252 family)
MRRVDPVELARRQLARDVKGTRRFPGLFEHKRERMRTSPLAFLRGAAGLFYELLVGSPELASGPSGEGWLAGDLHLENFGAYRPTPAIEDDPRPPSGRRSGPHGPDVVFNLNDFDEAIVGPWRYDVLRLMVSLVLGSRELRLRGAESVELCEALLDAYASAHLPEEPRVVTKLLEGVRTRSRKELLDARTRVVRGQREFVRGERYRDLPAKIELAARAAFERHAQAVSERTGVARHHFDIIDVAFRIAGTGSLGSLRIAVLVAGKGGIDGGWLFDMKEERIPAAAMLLGRPKMKAAKRVATAMRDCLEHPPLMLGTIMLDELSVLVRRLSPQEDKIDLGHLGPDDLEPLARYLGALTAAAHRRGAKTAAEKAWKRKERDALVERALVVAGVHEAAYLAYFKHCR